MNFFTKYLKATLTLTLLVTLPLYANAQVNFNSPNQPSVTVTSSITNSQTSSNAYAPDRIIVKYKKNSLAPLSSTMATSAQSGDEVPIKHFRGSKSIDGLHKKHHVKGMRKVFRKHKRPAFAASMNAVDSKKTAILDGLANQDIYVLDLTTKDKIKEAVEDFKKDPNVEYAQLDYIAKATFTPNDPYFQSRGSWGQTHDDLWALKKINAPQAWDIKQGQGVVVAVIDSGVDYNHPDIAANMVPGWNYIDNNDYPMDRFGHGTHVAGTIAAIGNNNLGIIGVAPRAKIMPLKALDDNGNGYMSTLAYAISYAAANGAKVINNSWGCSGCSYNPVVEDAVRFATQQGSIVVFAAGNDAVDVSTLSPQNMTDHKPLVVAASRPDDTLADFSNYGDLVDVTAPGGGPGSTDPDKRGILSLKSTVCSPDMCPDTLIVGTNYVRQAGTSMAAPHVSGLAALILSNNSTFSNDTIKTLIKWSANPLPNLQGSGLIDAAKAMATHSVPLGTFDPSANFIIPTTNLIAIKGTAGASANFKNYELAYSTQSTPTNWIIINSSTNQVINNTLGMWNITNLTPNIYHLRLRVWVSDNPDPLTIEKPTTIYEKETVQISYNKGVQSVAVEGDTAAWINADNSVDAYDFKTKQRIRIPTGGSHSAWQTASIPEKVFINNGYIIVADRFLIGIYNTQGNLIKHLDTFFREDKGFFLWKYGSLITDVNKGRILINFGVCYDGCQYPPDPISTPAFSYIYDIKENKLSSLDKLNVIYRGGLIDDNDVIYYLKPVLDPLMAYYPKYDLLETYDIKSKSVSSFPSKYSTSEFLKAIINHNPVTDSGPITAQILMRDPNLIYPNDIIRKTDYNGPGVSRSLIAQASKTKFVWNYNASADVNILHIEDKQTGQEDIIGISPYSRKAIAVDDKRILWTDSQGVFSYTFPTPPVFQPISTINAKSGTSLTIPIKAIDPSGSKLTLTVAGTGPSDLASYMPGAIFKDNGDGTGVLTWAIPGSLPTKVYNLNFTATNASGRKASILATVNLTASITFQTAKTAIDQYFSILMSGRDATVAKNSMNTAMSAVTIAAEKTAVTQYYNSSSVTNTKKAIDNYFKTITSGQDGSYTSGLIMNAVWASVYDTASQATVTTYYNTSSVTNTKLTIDNYFKAIMAGQDSSYTSNLMDTVWATVSIYDTASQATVTTYYNTSSVTNTKTAINNYFKTIMAGQDGSYTKNLMNTVWASVYDTASQTIVNNYYNSRIPKVTINPNPCVLQPGQVLCTVNVSWQSPVLSQIWVKMDNQPEKLFACGTSKTQTATWIQKNHTYQFNMYSATTCSAGSENHAVVAATASTTAI